MDKCRYSWIAHGQLPIWNPCGVSHLQRYVGQLRLREGSGILDIGCGRGHLLNLILSQYNACGMGVDSSPYAIAEAARSAAALVAAGRLTLVERAFEANDYDAGSFDLIVCIGSTHAVGGYGGVLKTVRRLLRAGGMLLVGEGYWKHPPSADYLTFLQATADEHGTHQVTQSGAIVGTPSYMAPEQAAGRKDLTTAADVYSLGAILYTMLTSRPPFRADTPLETMREVLEVEPSRPRLLKWDVDRDLETVCLKCLEKQPERRYGSAAALAEDLDRWLVGETIHARRSSLWERAIKNARRHPARAALLTVSTLALVGLVAATLMYQEQREMRQLGRTGQVLMNLDGRSGHDPQRWSLSFMRASLRSESLGR